MTEAALVGGLLSSEERRRVADVGLPREAICPGRHAAPVPAGSPSQKGRGSFVEGTYLAADTAGMAKKPEPGNLFWLTYRHSDGRAAGVVVVESHGLLQARLKVGLAGTDRD